jgi:hypothetical protein
MLTSHQQSRDRTKILVAARSNSLLHSNCGRLYRRDRLPPAKSRATVSCRLSAVDLKAYVPPDRGHNQVPIVR